MIYLPTILIHEVSRFRPSGYVEDLLSHGLLIDGGETLVLKEKDYQDLARKYSGLRLGNLVHKILRPITKILDRVIGTKLAQCSGCARRQKWLNRIRIPGW